MNKLINFITSPARFSFVLIMVTACVAFMIGKMQEGNFMIIVSAGLAFFFAYKPKNSDGEIDK